MQSFASLYVVCYDKIQSSRNLVTTELLRSFPNISIAHHISYVLCDGFPQSIQYKMYLFGSQTLDCSTQKENLPHFTSSALFKIRFISFYWTGNFTKVLGVSQCKLSMGVTRQDNHIELRNNILYPCMDVGIPRDWPLHWHLVRTCTKCAKHISIDSLKIALLSTSCNNIPASPFT